MTENELKFTLSTKPEYEIKEALLSIPHTLPSTVSTDLNYQILNLQI